MGQKVITYGPKSTRSPLGNTVLPLKDMSSLKFQKSSAPGKYTTSKFSSPPKIRGGPYPESCV